MTNLVFSLLNIKEIDNKDISNAINCLFIPHKPTVVQKKMHKDISGMGEKFRINDVKA